MSLDGVEITGYDQPGELVVQSPSVVLGYLNNDKANLETFMDDTDGGDKWMRTGDEAVFRKAPSGNEHVFIVDRIKELIKVKVCGNLTSEISLNAITDERIAGVTSRTSGTRSSYPKPSLGFGLCSDPNTR